ncbi:uncharacterized protein MONOS_11783 [Monocercomonoides exilis]|uniref:uncharacterized protein n=1 Tax=Monocercomonoides exilis TaxID=2049356 RepID=UPI00355A2913|nr:hypothetical protein MONOS_11783 [Monocercomonoides exilis]|eukprot:MONOS_11783.1-p1 / transcript=MONOS_11783.1 / gene=MONOS_11783 / organism=Monocercomonoides_exilis_PA203 / gene_product=unspecified product / transcript_product=unspecified product / location=Mono_scaffold00611:4108-4494(-) / protein_length=129 / sequence_SO=supercontig / SO=protein_coding / is_pseudo=false
MKPLRANSIVAHGICCVLPQPQASVPLLPTILIEGIRGSQLLYTALSAVPAFHTLFDSVVEPHCCKGDLVIALPLKNTSFPVPLVAELLSKKQKVMNLISFIQVKDASKEMAAPPRVDEVDVNLLFKS